ncbi:MAG: TIGR03943 family protein [Anaerolineae bacterium]|nr:TIGR03943 family protein [Caldilineales bacterium]MCX7853016.1 TIGR03943 family protein [Caldilineales bacterium]MDW8269483.1 TIGR03943 family protein [Anaerolineae bacterium]
MSVPHARSVKALFFLALAFFFARHFLSGTLFYYIGRRFAWLVPLAAVGCLLMALGVLFHRPEPHDHGEDDGHRHGYTLTWMGLALVVVPLLLGWLIPPRPLDSAALSTREIGLTAPDRVATGPIRPLSLGPREKNILDWLAAFAQNPDPQAFVGQEAHVVGFVYRDERFETETSFMVTRFAITCCVADATAVGLLVRWPQAGELATDTWVEVRGRFALGVFQGQSLPVLVAESVTPVEPPAQPYLYY